MKKDELAKLSDAELLKLAKTMKNSKTYDAVIIGFLIGIAIYSAVTNGIGLFTLLPLVYLPIAGRNRSMRGDLRALLDERNLECEAS